MNDEPAKVRCRTCHGDHDYRHEQAPPSKADLRKQALYKEVLDKMGRGEDGAAPEAPATDGTAPAEPVAAAEAASDKPAKAKRAKPAAKRG
jgi:hypothetical protein